MRSLQTVVETGGLGIGIGSSRASNWLIAVLSQTGVIGAALQLVLVAVLLRPLHATSTVISTFSPFMKVPELQGLPWLVAATVSAGAADPGIFFFICLAAVMSSRDALLASQEASRLRHDVELWLDKTMLQDALSKKRSDTCAQQADLRPFSPPA